MFDDICMWIEIMRGCSSSPKRYCKSHAFNHEAVDGLRTTGRVTTRIEQLCL